MVNCELGEEGGNARKKGLPPLSRNDLPSVQPLCNRIIDVILRLRRCIGR